MYQRILLPILLLLSFNLLGQETNLVVNGQFLNGTNAWEVLLDDANQSIKAHIEKGNSYKEYGLADNFIGTNFVELDEQSAIQQKIKTTPGKAHILSFAYAHRPDAGTKQLIVAINGKAVYTTTVKNTSETGVFTYKDISFTPSETTTKIAFYSVSLSGAADKGILLTDIRCVDSTHAKEISDYKDIKY